MPGMDGLELRQAIAADPSLTTRVLLMTGLGQDHDLGEGATPADATYVSKPIHPDAVHASLRAALVPAALIAIFVLFVVDRIDIREAVVLSLAASLILLPDITRTEFIAVPFLLIMRLTRWRLAAIWVAAALSAVATVGASNKASTLPFSSILERLFDSTEYEGSLFYVFVINLFLFVVIALYAADRLRGRVDVELSHDLRFHPPGGAARRPDPTVAAALD